MLQLILGQDILVLSIFTSLDFPFLFLLKKMNSPLYEVKGGRKHKKGKMSNEQKPTETMVRENKAESQFDEFLNKIENDIKNVKEKDV